MAGTAPTTPLPSLLGQIYLGGRTGTLRIAREGQRLGLGFEKGRLVRALAQNGAGIPALPLPAPDDELGKHLLRVLTELRVERPRNGSGPTPCSRGSLLESLGWPESDVAFTENELEAGPDGGAQATTEELVLESVRRLDPRAVQAALGDTRRPLALAVNPDFDRELSTTDAYLLSRVDGKTSAAEILMVLPQEPEAAERSLLGLVLTGVVEFQQAPTRPTPPAREAPPVAASPSPQPAAPEMDEETRRRLEPRRREILEAYDGLAHQSHFEILSVSEMATEAELKQAYFNKAKKFHPDQYRDPSLADIADRLEAVFLRIGAAYDVLRDPQSRQSYEAALRRRRATEHPGPRAAAATPGLPPDPQAAAELNENLVIDSAENVWMAEEAIHRADRLVHDSKVWDAIQLLQAIIPKIYARKQRERARVLLAKAYIKNPNWLRRGEELLQTVIQEDPENAEAHFALGMLYKESGMSSRAVNMFKKALELKPEHKQAQVALDSMSGPAFLRKLFGKG